MLRDKLLPGTKPGFLKSKKMLRFILLYILYINIYLYIIYKYIFIYYKSMNLNILTYIIYKYIFICYKSMNLNIFSDLRKPGLVPGESLSLSTNINSVLEKNQIYIVLIDPSMKSHMGLICHAISLILIFSFRHFLSKHLLKLM